MGTRSDVRIGDTTAVEVGVFEYEGREYAAGGFWIDLDLGRMVAYVSGDPLYPGTGRMAITTWGGERIAGVIRTGYSWGFHGTRLESFRTTEPVLGHYWYGRGLGLEMALRLRRGRKA